MEKYPNKIFQWKPLPNIHGETLPVNIDIEFIY